MHVAKDITMKKKRIEERNRPIGRLVASVVVEAAVMMSSGSIRAIVLFFLAPYSNELRLLFLSTIEPMRPPPSSYPTNTE